MPDEEDKNKYWDILLTDIQLHVTEHSHPKPFDRQVVKSIRSGKPSRVYNQLPPPDKPDKNTKDGTFKIDLMSLPEVQRAQIEAQKRGKTLRIVYPKEGLKVYAGKDTTEFIEARKNQKWKPFKELVGK